MTKIYENQRRIYGNQRNCAFDSYFIIKSRWRQSMKINENRRKHTKIYGNIRKSTKNLIIYENQRKTIKIDEKMEIYEILWKQWKIIKIYEISWNLMPQTAQPAQPAASQLASQAASQNWAQVSLQAEPRRHSPPNIRPLKFVKSLENPINKCIADKYSINQ